MERNNWTVNVSTVDLIVAIDKKIEHHTKRLEHWKAELQVAEDNLKQNGYIIEEEESFQGMNSNAYASASRTLGPQVRVQPNQEAVNTYQKARERVNHHMTQIDANKMYKRTCELAVDQSFVLNPDDVVYFSL